MNVDRQEASARLADVVGTERRIKEFLAIGG